MKVQRVNFHYQINRQCRQARSKSNPLSFQGKCKYAKTLGSVFGTAGALATLTDTLVTGIFSLPLFLMYTAVAAASGLIIGHEYDKDADKSENEICKKS